MSARTRDVLALGGLLVLAALLRLPNLETRGTWDGDQGHDMLVLYRFVRDGIVPLLGPPTSIGDFHHGAHYYYLLSPVAAVTGGESPLAVVAAIALAGIAAVAVTWWLARAIGGPIAGLVAGLLMAVSISAIDESTFIWNPNLVPLSSSIALAAAWHAWSTGRPAWWIAAAAAAILTMQFHVLGIVFTAVIGALFVADVMRSPAGSAQHGAVLRAGVIGAVLIAVSYLPLLVNELTTGFAETNAAIDFLEGGEREGSDVNTLARIAIVGLRIVSWPLVGLIVDAGAVALLAALAVVVLGVWLARGPGGPERTAARWLGLGLVWSTIALAMAATSLASVVRGLPNDHYHAFADPMVLVLVGVGCAALVRRVPRVGPAIAAAIVVGLVAWNVTRLPPATAPDLGYPGARAATERIEAAAGDRAIALHSIPDFKSTEAYAYLLVVDGRDPVAEDEAGALVVICDALFETVVEAACAGPAEDVALADGARARFTELRDRWQATPRRTISVYVAP
ncbi:MAG TPA: hypothetical protein VLA44_05865 [Clostridia bacterium]|nr:hypothetical protein [Clostridia bacterium]